MTVYLGNHRPDEPVDPKYMCYVMIRPNICIVGPFASPTAALQWSSDYELSNDSYIMMRKQMVEHILEHSLCPVISPTEYRP